MESNQEKISHGTTLGALLLTACLTLTGCSPGPPQARTLIIISPHRDEIRQEVALAFEDWFQARTRERVARANAALRAETSETDVADAFAELFADWEESDVRPLAAALEAWRCEPTPAHAEVLRSALDLWRQQLPPIAVVWQDIGGGTSQLVRDIRSRFEATPDGIGVDLLFGGGTDIYVRFADEGLLEKVKMPAPLLHRIRPDLNGVPLYDPEGRWYGPMLSSFGILCNRWVLERIGRPEPRTWSDLGRPELQSWVSAGDPRMSGSVHMVYEIILQRPQGWDDGMRLLLRLGANTHTFIRDSGTLTQAVIGGEVAAAGNLDANALSAVGRFPHVMSYQLPVGETVINPDAIAVLKGAPRRNLARAFVEFTLSDAGQKLFFLQPGLPGGPRRYPLCRLSVVEQLYAEYKPEDRSTGATNPFTAGGTIRYQSALGVRRWDALNDLFGAWIVDAHPDLTSAWRAVIDSPLPEPDRRRLEEELFRPPCTEEALNQYARALQEGSPRVRIETITRWGEEARERYRRVRREAEMTR